MYWIIQTIRSPKKTMEKDKRLKEVKNFNTKRCNFCVFFDSKDKNFEATCWLRGRKVKRFNLCPFFKYDSRDI